MTEGQMTEGQMTEEQRPRGSQEPLDTAYDVALLDLDGVVYLGGTAIPGAAEALRKADAAGMRLAYVTNNAFRTPAAIAALLTSFGAPASPQDVVTSAQAAARLLAERLPAGAPVLVIGGSGLRMAVRERGLRPVSTAADKPARPPAGQRIADPGSRDRDRGAATGGGQARTPAAPRIGAAHRGQASARGRRPAGHRHRGRPPGRGGQHARADRGHRAGRSRGRAAVAAPHLPGRRPDRPARAASGGQR